MKNSVYLSILILSFIFSSCGLFSTKQVFNVPDKQDIEKIKEDAMKQKDDALKEANEMAGGDNTKRDRLKKEGKEAPAVIEKIEDTNVTFNKNPKIRMYLKVKPKGEDPFDAVVEMVVSRVNIPRSGDNATVYYNPNDKTDIIVK